MSAAAGLSPAKQALLARMLRGEAPTPSGAIPRRAGDGPPPLAPEQRQIWLHAASAPDAPIYNEPITIHRRGPCDPERLEASLAALLHRHPIWRTGFRLRDGEVVQHVAPEAAVRLGRHDLRALPAAEREAAALRLATADARRPFALDRPPLLRGLLVRMEDDLHRLYLTLHHLIFDGIALYRVFLPELAALYAGEGGALPPPALDYADYAAWRAGQESADPQAGADDRLAYWRTTLAGAPAALPLPTDRPRPEVASHAGAMARFRIPAATEAALRAIGRTQGATLYMVLLAAFKTLLSRLGGGKDLVVGGIADLRGRPELQDVPGYFLNAVALRSRPAGDLPFRAFLVQVRETVLGALAHAGTPFDQVVRALAPRRLPGCHPLFQVLFSIQPPVPVFAPGWDMTQMDVATGATKFDLYLELEERPDGLVGRFLYATALFDADRIARMIGHYLTLLDGVAADPEAPLARLTVLTAAERAAQAEWNAAPDAPLAALLPAMLRDAMRRHATATAVIHGAERWSYAALDRQAEAIAAGLRAAGAGPGTVVGLCADRSCLMLAALLAILRTGAAYLPLDPSLPAARLAVYVADAGPGLLLAARAHADRVARPGTRLLVLEEAAIDAPPVVADPAPDDLAYVLFTSGSTGRPKGVEVPHRGLANVLRAMRQETGIGPGDRLLAITTLAFDIAAIELFLPLIAGATVVLAGRDEAADPRRLAELIAASGATFLQATPATWRALVAAGWAGQAGLGMIAGGETLTRSLADALLARGGRLWNGYGPTEAAIYATLHEVGPAEDPVPIGRPIPHTTAHVLDPDGNPLPVGVPGELHLGGAGLARGYRGRPELTAERFVVRPGLPAPLYRTGDLAQFRAEGALLYLGRADAQLKLRGFRIEPEEVEAALATHPGIAAAAIRAWPDAAGQAMLAGYVVPRAGPVPAVALRTHLAATLPDYMVPTRLVTLPALPLTASGKLDRNALPAPGAPEAGGSPATPREQALARIWAATLDLPQVGPEDDFFELGGHSLLAPGLLRRIAATFGQDLPLAAVFRAPTVRRMAALLGAASKPLPASEQAMPERELMLRFESLGDSCEFGFVQRRHGAEPLSLLRFTGIAPADLAAALEADFAGYDDPAQLDVAFDAGEGACTVRHRGYRTAYVLFLREGETNPAAIRRSETRKLAVLRRKLLRDLAGGDRICVLKHADPIDPDLLGRLQATLRRHGPSTLFEVTLADAGHAPGLVERAGPYLLRGWIDAFAPATDQAAGSLLWLSLCRSAYALWRER